MKHSKVKQVDRYEIRDADVDEAELEIDLDEAEEEVEADWNVMDNDSAETAELDEDTDLFEEEPESAPVDEGEFDTVAHYFRESALTMHG